MNNLFQDPLAETPLEPFRNITSPYGEPPQPSKSLMIYLTSALVAVCYLLASIVCCRCYFQHLKKSSTGPEDLPKLPPSMDFGRYDDEDEDEADDRRRRERRERDRREREQEEREIEEREQQDIEQEDRQREEREQVNRREALQESGSEIPEGGRRETDEMSLQISVPSLTKQLPEIATVATNNEYELQSSV